MMTKLNNLGVSVTSLRAYPSMSCLRSEAPLHVDKLRTKDKRQILNKRQKANFKQKPIKTKDKGEKNRAVCE